MSPPAGFAAKLRWWRGHRGFSQLELAGRADISQRHLSFLELGRSAPSRAMVLRLAVALDVPLRQQNALLLAAGFAPLWRETALAAPELAQVRSGLDYMLRQQEPFPAVVVDRCWNLIQANAGAVRLVEFLSGHSPPEVPINLADALVGPDLLRPFLVNWDDVVRYFIRSVEADAAADGSAETAALLQRLLAYAGVGAVVKQHGPRAERPRSADALSEGRDLARPVHDDCDAWHAAGHHAAGAAHRMLLPDGRAHGRRLSFLGRRSDGPLTGAPTMRNGYAEVSRTRGACRRPSAAPGLRRPAHRRASGRPARWCGACARSGPRRARR